jgi:hypothetical protein
VNFLQPRSYGVSSDRQHWNPIFATTRIRIHIVRHMEEMLAGQFRSKNTWEDA